MIYRCNKVISAIIGLSFVLGSTSCASSNTNVQTEIVPTDYSAEQTTKEVSEPNESINDIDKLNGLYKLNSDEKTFVSLDNERVRDLFTDPETGSWMCICQSELYESYFEGDKEGIWDIFSAHPIQIHSGEKLVLAGDEWTNLDEEQKSKGIIYCRNAESIGYGNIQYTTGMYGGNLVGKHGVINRLNLSDINTISGIEILKSGSNARAYSDALSKTNLKMVSNEIYYTLLSKKKDDTIDFSYYEGTKSVSKKVVMSDPFYCIHSDSLNTSQSFFMEYHDYELQINKTDKGYFIIDTSVLGNGLYVIQSYSGFYLIEIV